MSFIKNLFKQDKKAQDTQLNWLPLERMEQLDTIVESSKVRPVAIFKHSTRCSISFMAKNRLESNWDFEGREPEMYLLDLIAYRAISNEIAERFNVVHQSPQLILLYKGEVIYDESHNGIQVEELNEFLP